MRIYRLSILPTSLQLTRWQADTLFGTLCWALRHRDGEEKLKQFLEPFLAGEPPFLLSDWMPAGYLPLPFHVRLMQSEKRMDVEAYRKLKALKKVRHLSEEGFAKACRGELVEVEEEARELIVAAPQLHACINRATGTTTGGDEEAGASLFELHGWVPGRASTGISVYIADRTGRGIDLVVELMRDVELSGFGKKKSSGMGAFKIEGNPVEWEPPSTNGKANGFVSLSGFVPARNDPTMGFWQILVKHGKLGEEYAVGGDPFKYPWIVLEAGSSFFTADVPREFYGRMLERISPKCPQVVQYGYAFPIPMVIPEEVAQKALKKGEIATSLRSF
jgi:CRISPR-associated protein Csm4